MISRFDASKKSFQIPDLLFVIAQQTHTFDGTAFCVNNENNFYGTNKE